MVVVCASCIKVLKDSELIKLEYRGVDCVSLNVVVFTIAEALGGDSFGVAGFLFPCSMVRVSGSCMVNTLLV